MQALGVLGPSKAATDILIKIVTTIRDAKRLKAECAEIEVFANICLQTLQKHQAITLDDRVSHDFWTFLIKLLKLVVECRDSNMLQRVWETVWRQRLASLKQQFVTWLAILSAGTTLAARADLLRLIETTSDGSRSEEHLHAIVSKLQILDDIKRNQENTGAGDLVVDFEESDERLRVFLSESEDILQGTLRGPDGSLVSVTCDPVQEQLMTFGEKGPRHVLIYSRLSENTRVHPFYGIARRNGKRWTVFRDMTSCDTLNTAILRKKLLPQSLPERLAVAREIALTVDYLHTVDILIKRLSDQHILLQEEHGRLIPYITNMESARLFKETSTGRGAYDVRYEALELSQAGGSRHNIYTDVWSLGILIWQCIASVVPFGFDHEVTKEPERNQVLQSIREGIMPWDRGELIFPDQPKIVNQAISLCRACCASVAKSRPSAAEIVYKLSDLITSANMSIDPDQSLGEDLQKRVRTAIQAACRKEGGNKFSINPDDTELLHALAGNGDITAAYLLGASIWLEAARPMKTQSQGDMSLLLVAGVDRQIESRCRTSILYLERALQGGEKKASQCLAQAHSQLAKLYTQLTDQNKVVGV